VAGGCHRATSDRPLRVLIMHDQPLFGEALAVALGVRHRTLTVIGWVSDVQVLLSDHRRRGPSADVLLVGTPSGLAEIQRCHTQLAARYPGVFVVALGGTPPCPSDQQALHPIPAMVGQRPRPSLRQLVKHLELIRQRVGHGPPAAFRSRKGVLLIQRSHDATGGLTLRERDILRLRRQGLRNKDIAHALQIGLQTVKNHLYAVTRKLQPRPPQTPSPGSGAPRNS